jgi:hypothetical protein
MRNSFLLYTDLWQTLQHCNDEQLGKITRLIFDYVTTGNSIDVEHPLFFLFNPIKVHLDRDKDKYESIVESRSIAGKVSAARRLDKRNKSQQVLTSVNTSEQDSTNPTDNVNDNVNDIPNYKKMDSNQFKQELAKHRGEYSDEMLRQFFIYWSEADSKGRMRFQLEKTWSIKGRLVRWQLNNKQDIKLPVKEEPKSRAWNA